MTLKVRYWTSGALECLRSQTPVEALGRPVRSAMSGRFTEVLMDLGYRSIDAEDGVTALKLLNSSVQVDLPITDVGLPNGINGRQVADAAHVQRPRLKILFITGYAENAVLNHGHLGSDMHVMTKPFAIDALALRVQEILS